MNITEESQRELIERGNISLHAGFSVLDVFCGCGGLSEGFREAGFDIYAGIDNDNESLVSYSYNFPESKAINADLMNPAASFPALDELLPEKVDVLVGGPPCQGFSIAGKRFENDPRNRLYKAFLHLIRQAQPMAVIMENVPTILSLYKGAIAKRIISDLESYGYNIKVFTLIASDYSVPQNRKRTFFVGLQDDRRFLLPDPTSLFSKITTEMALSDLPLLEDEFGGEIMEYAGTSQNIYQEEMRAGSSCLYNHWAVAHKEKTKAIISLVPDGGNYKDLPEHLQNTRKVNIAWTRMNSKKPCFTIDAGHNHHFHYKANRVPTVRECARIQSFPDRFRFIGKKTSQFRQVGNAVPPRLVKAIAIELKNTLNNG